MATFYAARSEVITPLPWLTFALPFSIDGRTTRHQGYDLSIKHRKRIEEAFGWAKTVGGMAQTVYRGVERVRSRFILTMAANNLARLPRLLGA